MIKENVKYQPRFQAYINYMGLKEGDTFKNHEYIIFIQSNLSKFLTSKGLKRDTHLNKEIQEEFTQYLFSLTPEKQTKTISDLRKELAIQIAQGHGLLEKVI